MQIGTFRKNVMKTVAVKPAKLGLKMAAKNTLRTNVFHASVSLKTNTGKLMQSVSQYVLGLQLSQEMKETALVSMADMGYDLTLLCRLLKVKMPTATKKSKLTGTRTAAILQLDALTTDLLQVVGEGVFTGPKMTKVTKMVVLPNKAGAKEEREVEVVDTVTESAMETERQTAIKSLLTGIVDLYWRLCFDLFQKPPVILFENKFVRLQSQYPDIEFTVVDEPESAPATA